MMVKFKVVLVALDLEVLVFRSLEFCILYCYAEYKGINALVEAAAVCFSLILSRF